MYSSVMDREFTRNFLISLGVHAALIVFAFLGGKLIMDVFGNKDVEIIRAAVRVDVVGMPKFTVQELKAIQKEPELPKEPEVAKGEKVETKTETEDVIKKDDLVIQEEGKPKKKSSFMNLVADYSAKKVAPKEKAKGSSTGVAAKNLDSLVLEGNRLSQGTALVGDYSDEANSAFAAYVQMLPGIIRDFWKLPGFLMEKDLRCRIRIHLSSVGQLLKLEVIESSGEPEFDARAEKAIRGAAPFPKPSEEVGQRLTKSGIILGFPL
jgi:colicin import membrane protein